MVFTCIILYFAATLFIPLLFGLFIAIVLYPVCKWLENHSLSRSIAITLSISIVAALFFGIACLFAMQIHALHRDWPEINSKLQTSLPGIQQWIERNLSISISVQNKASEKLIRNIVDNPGSLLTGAFNRTTTGFFILFITPVFAALFLYRRRDFIFFLEKMAGEKYQTRLHGIVHKTIHTYFQFIKGMALVYIIVGTLNSLGLLALGIRHAVLFGYLTAVMTIIPYVGIIVSALLPISIAWITKDSMWYPLGVVAVFMFVQWLEANIIFPRVVAAQLGVSTWITLVAIIAGGILWGVSGMILFIPFVGILKLIAEFVPEWEALSVLLSRDPMKKLS